MTPKCASIVRAAAARAGRTVSPAKLAALDDALSGHLRELAREARNEATRTGKPNRWLGMTKDQQMAEAVQRALAEVDAAAKLAEYQATLQGLRSAETAARVADQRTRGTDVTHSQAVARDAQNVEAYAHAVRNMAVSQLSDLFKAVESRDGTGLMRGLAMRLFGTENPQMTGDVVREVFRNGDGHTGNKQAQAAAKAWLETIEQMRQRFNAAGGNIGKLGYGYLAQAHDSVRVLGDGSQTAMQRWVDTVAPLVDREQYVRVDGSLMDDAEVRRMLSAAWETIATRGDNKTEPGAFKGTGKRANRGSDHRVLHFKDGDAWMAYMQEYGQGSLYDSMIGHLNRVSRDIALVENYGPNPAQTYRVQADIGRRQDGAGTIANRHLGNTPEVYWDLVSGNTGAPENATIAFWGKAQRDIQTAAKITAGPLAAFGDAATIATTLRFDRLPYMEMLRNIGRRWKPGSEEHDFLLSQGVIAESIGNDFNRITGDHLAHNLTGNVTNAVMRASLMNAWTDSLRGAFAATMMRNFAKYAGKAWSDLDAWDQQLMARHGLTEADWSIITRATPVDRGGLKYLSANAVREVDDLAATQAATRWLAFVNDESQFAVVNPDLATRAIVTGGGRKAGTIAGEAWRSIFQFKSFPIAMITRHLSRIMDTPQGLEGAPAGFSAESRAGAIGSRIAVLAAFAAAGMMMGAIQTQTRHVVAGRDPVEMDPTTEIGRKFWKRAFAAGGGGGYFADILLAPMDDAGFGFESKLSMMGPAMGAVGGVIDITKATTNQGARAAQWINDQLPGVDIWYLRGMWEHWVLHNLQEMLNPGYTSRIEQRAQKNWEQEYYWAPGDAVPDRSPDIMGAFGQ